MVKLFKRRCVQQLLLCLAIASHDQLCALWGNNNRTAARHWLTTFQARRAEMDPRLIEQNEPSILRCSHRKHSLLDGKLRSTKKLSLVNVEEKELGRGPI